MVVRLGDGQESYYPPMRGCVGHWVYAVFPVDLRVPLLPRRDLLTKIYTALHKHYTVFVNPSYRLLRYISIIFAVC
jgi:hypothetical protein